MKERSLVAFTLLSQMAVGSFWVLVGLRAWASWQLGTEAAGALTDGALLAVGPVMLLAIVSSFFHLGAPFKSWRAIANLRSSWLSREVLCALLFAAGTLIIAALQWLDWGSSAAWSVLAGTVALLGLALLVSMTNAYRLRTVPAWDTWVTPVSFFATALLLGGLAAGAMLAVGSHAPPEPIRASLQWIALGTILALTAELVILLAWIARLSTGQGAAARAAIKLTKEHRRIFGLRVVLAVAGLAAACAVLAPWGKGTRADTALLLAFGLVLVSEVLGRLLFYEARVRHGV